jgi:transposase InsO family protein
VELKLDTAFQDLEAAARRTYESDSSIDRFRLGFYNSTRLQQTLGYVSPMEFEKRWTAAQQQDRKTA